MVMVTVSPRAYFDLSVEMVMISGGIGLFIAVNVVVVVFVIPWCVASTVTV